ncbi:hypothetical protein GCM10009565_74730 [Amycolatopsis albidoflavus]
MRAERRNVAHPSLDVREGHRRQQRVDRGVFGADRPPAVAGAQLRVGYDVGHLFYLCGRDSGLGQPLVQVRCGPSGGFGGDCRVAFRAVLHPLDICGESRVFGQVRSFQD